MIELGRHQINHVPRENRLCPLCKSKQIENENHLLFQFQEYSSLRKVFLHQVSEIVPDIQKSTPTTEIITFLNCNDYFMNKLVMKFISPCMNIRDSLLLATATTTTTTAAAAAATAAAPSSTATIPTPPPPPTTTTTTTTSTPTPTLTPITTTTLGRPTFHGKNGTNVIDFLIRNKRTFLNVANFVVKHPSYLSDHSAIVEWLNLNTRLIVDETHPPSISSRLSKLRRQFCWEIDSHLKFKIKPHYARNQSKF